MALITEQATLTSADTFTETTINNRYTPLVQEFNGNIDNANLKSAAAIASTKVADTALVSGNTVSPGEQSISRPTRLGARVQFKEAELGGWSFDEDDTQAIDLTGVTTFALTVGKGLYTITSTGAAGLATITGGQEGDVVYLASIDTDVSITNTDALTVDTIVLRDSTTWSGVAGGMFIRLRYSAIFGTGKWYEI